MAKFDSADPRWIVEERQDGRNVNAWHWEEKSILSQVKQRLQEAFNNVSVDLQGKPGVLTICSCKNISGEACINTRKGNKRFCVYDLKMTIEWEAAIMEDKKISGTMSVDEFASACEEDDYLIEISSKDSGADADTAKNLMESHGKPEVLARLVALAKELQECA